MVLIDSNAARRPPGRWMLVRSALIFGAVMDTTRISIILLSCGVAAFGTVMPFEVSAAPPPGPTSRDVRGAVERSLPYVEKVSTAWMQERKCNSCHNVTFLVW